MANFLSVSHHWHGEWWGGGGGGGGGRTEPFQVDPPQLSPPVRYGVPFSRYRKNTTESVAATRRTCQALFPLKHEYLFGRTGSSEGLARVLTAHGTGAAGSKPLVDAAAVEGVRAARQPPNRLGRSKLVQANGARKRGVERGRIDVVRRRADVDVANRRRSQQPPVDE